MTILRSLCLVAVVAGGFLFAAGTDSAEAGRHFRGHRGHHGHRHFHRHFRHHGYGYGHGYRYQRYYTPRYVAPVQYLWCDIHDCYYYIDSYGHRQYIR